MSDDLEDRLRRSLDREASRLAPRHAAGPPEVGVARPWWRQPRTMAPAVGLAALVVAGVVAVVVTAGGTSAGRLDVTGRPGGATVPLTATSTVPTCSSAVSFTVALLPCTAPDVRPTPTSTPPTTAPAPAAATTTTVPPKRLVPVIPGGPVTAPAAAPATSTTAAPAATGAACQPSQLTLGTGPAVSEATGQHTLDLTLTNSSPVACTLQGYPGISLLAADGSAIPFVFARSGDQMVTGAAPAAVTVAPGQEAWERINKYRCDVGDQTAPATVQLIPPTGVSGLHVAVPPSVDLAYCAAGDPGSTVDLSPVEPSQAALYP